MGLNGPLEVKSHPWFNGFPWEQLANKQIIAPFIPEQADNFDVKVTNDGWKDEESDKMKESAILLRRETVQDLFKGYYYDKSFEGYGFKIEEKPKQKIKEKTIVQIRKPAHKSCQPSPGRIAINTRHQRSISGKSKPMINIKNTKRNDQQQLSQISQKSNTKSSYQRYKPISRGLSQSNYNAPENIKAKIALPKGPFHYRNESKKISQI